MSKLVLLVDDNRLLRMIMAEMLENSGYEVRHAGDGVEALQLMKADPPDIVVADYYMPNMDGAEMVRTIRASDMKETPILAVAGSKDAESIMRAAGIDMYLEKPIDEPRLISAVSALLKVPMHQE